MYPDTESKMTIHRVVALICVASLGLVFGVTPAYANSSFEVGSPDDIIKAAENATELAGVEVGIDAPLVHQRNELIAETLTNTVQIAGTEGEVTTIMVSDLATGIESQMTLPRTSGGNLVTTNNSGAVVTPSVEEPNTAYAIHPTEEGNVRVESIIVNEDAPEEFDFTFPGISRIEVYEEEGVAWLFSLDEDGEEQLAGVVDAPWARDANGIAVPTHFKADGNTLTQVVEHRSGNFVYPIVADPNWWDNAVAWAQKNLTNAINWLKSHRTWIKRSGTFLAKKVAPGALVLCAVGGAWSWYRSDARGWVRVGDAIVGCIG